MALGPLDDEFEYPWLQNPTSGTTRSGVLLSPGMGWDGTNFIRPDGGLVNMGLTSAGTKYSDTIVNNGINGANSIWGKNGMLPTMFQGLSALGGLMQAYSGFKGLELAKEQLENSKNAFRTQFEANRNSVGEQVRNAAATNYAMHNGTARDFNESEQRQVADSEANRVKNSYKNYV